jgi:hypothetical protein
VTAPGISGSVWLANFDRDGCFAEPVKGWGGLDFPPKERNSDRSGNLRELRSDDAGDEIEAEFCRIGEEGSISDIGSMGFGITWRQGRISDVLFVERCS